MTLTIERQQFAEQNEMTMDFVNWFFDHKKEGCGNAWFIMAVAMWEGWKEAQAQPVSQGYKLVPVEPTNAAYRESGVYSPTAYRAMLAAAPGGIITD